MPYSIAYNSGSTVPFGTYKQGNILMGLKPQEYTVSSGFTWYANATTPNDNYLIISDTYSQGWSDQQNSKPTIWRSETGTTESFVSLVNQLPDVNGVTGFTDSGNAMKYLMDSGKYFVSKDNYLGIVSDGLIFSLDSAWFFSYSGSGTTWKNLKGDNNATLINGPSFNTDNGGVISFDGVDDFLKTQTITNYKSICFWVFWNGIGPLTFWQYLLDSRPGMTQGWFVPSANSQGGDWKSTFFVNGIQVTGCNETNVPKNKWNHIYLEGVNTSYTSTFNFMSRSSDNEQAGGKMGGIYVYNRALTTSEVLQNFNAQKGRFGL
jgi:hypothetical protein